MTIPVTNDPVDLERMELALHIALCFVDNYRGKAVGAILVGESGQLFGAGHRFTTHDKSGYKDYTPHAEYMALRWAPCEARREALTLYVTQEPCSQRLTHPDWFPFEACTTIIKRSGVGRVVIGCLETGAGSGGAELLLSQGIEVLQIDAAMQDRCRILMSQERIPERYAAYYEQLKQGDKQ